MKASHATSKQKDFIKEKENKINIYNMRAQQRGDLALEKELIHKVSKYFNGFDNLLGISEIN